MSFETSEQITWKLFFQHYTFDRTQAIKEIKKYMDGERTTRELSWGTVRILRLGLMRSNFKGIEGYLSEWEFTFNNKSALNKRKLQVPSSMQSLQRHVSNYDVLREHFEENRRAFQPRDIDFTLVQEDA